MRSDRAASLRFFAASCALAFAGAALIVTACGSSNGDSSGTTSTRSAGDGGNGASTSDGATSTKEPDGGSTTNATTGCAAYPKAGFCDDFESETTATLLDNWPDSTPDSEFVLPTVVTSSTAVSGTHVLHTDAPFITDAEAGTIGGGQRFSVVSRGLPTILQSQSIRVGFSFRIVSFVSASDSGSELPSPNVQVDLSPNTGARGGFALNLLSQDPTHLNVFLGGAEASSPSSNGIFAFAIGEWLRMDVTTTFAAGADAGQGDGTVTVTVTVNGTQVATQAFSEFGGVPYAGTFAGTLTLGSFGMSESPDTVVEFDDVIIEQD